jgi:hypothetical protein
LTPDGSPIQIAVRQKNSNLDVHGQRLFWIFGPLSTRFFLDSKDIVKATSIPPAAATAAPQGIAAWPRPRGNGIRHLNAID